MKIAVVGPGVSGLAATCQSNTIRYVPPGKLDGDAVDPNHISQFLRFLQPTPAIRILQTEMSFSVCRDSGLFEWAGKDLATLFCQPSRLLDPYMWRLIYDVLRFNTMPPMTAAISSIPPGKCFMNFPARTLVQFMSNHHLLQITGKPSLLSQCIILACHSDTCTTILKGGRGLCVDEEDILKSFEWNTNVAVLHSVINLMPKARTAWSCLNYLTFSSPTDINTVALTYYMNELQHLPEDLHGPVLVTLNPPTDPDVTKTAARFAYDHPILDTKAIIAQKLMPNIQGRDGVLFAGAWLGYGFHEDGFTSGLRAVAEHIETIYLYIMFKPLMLQVMRVWYDAKAKSK
ncbi:hypothetical protein EV702DRAFT_1177851 [Suillus placidus]|uniref:FAD/NAD(P)-binding domain-containing protein n=1 Tax=Suillus placidus TaxID=48579 RepID=A0A9P7A382_9AGAM|nr:hypothetical protein EV702DRAFT_1177851 [Suillus placidus]